MTKATAKRPADRFATAGEMALALRGSSVPDGAWNRRGRWRIAIAALALVGFASIVGFLALRDEDTPPAPPTQTTGPAPIPMNSLVQLDAETGEIRSTLTDLPSKDVSLSSLSEVEVGEGGVWVLAGGNLSHVDPEDETSLVVGNVPTFANSLAVGRRIVWLGGPAPGGVVRINPATDETLRPVRIGPADVVGFVYIAVGASGVWALTGTGELHQLDPFTGAITKTVDTGQDATGLAVGLDAVWVIDNFHRTLTRVDPNHLEDFEVFESPGRLDGIAVGAGGVWTRL